MGIKRNRKQLVAAAIALAGLAGGAVAAHATKCGLRISEIRINHVSVRVLEVCMVEEIKEICFEGDLGTFRDFEPLTHTKIHIGKVRSMKSTAPQRAIAPGTKVNRR